MNRPLRRVSIAIACLFVALLGNASWIMVGDAHNLDHRTDNPRPLFQRLTTHRGDIRLQDGTVIAESNHPTKTSTSYVRSYPQKSLYATVTGWAGAASTSNVELAEDDVLSGSDERLSLNNFTDTLSGKEKQGGYVVVTIDAAAQKAATQALTAAIGNSGYRGAVVAIDVHTGAIKALVGLPTYDPDTIATNDVATDEKAYTALNAKKVNPLLDTATQTRYPPGSMFKLVTSAAALTTGRWGPSTLLDAPNSYTPPLTSQSIINFGGESCGGSKVTFASALATSCNTAFAKLGVAVGQPALQQIAEGFTIGQTPTVKGLPSSSLSASQFVAPTAQTLDPPSLAQSSIGQYNVALTPLQAAMIVQAIGNGGQMLQPYLVDSEHAPDGSVLSGSQATPTPIGTPLSASVDKDLTSMMLGVTTTGTAAGVFTSLGYPVAGKTGTAQHSTGTESLPPHTWFAGFGPENAGATTPEYAVAAFVEDGGTAGNNGQGATVAAPIVEKVLAALTTQKPAATPSSSASASAKASTSGTTTHTTPTTPTKAPSHSTAPTTKAVTPTRRTSASAGTGTVSTSTSASPK